eukprot:8459534-Heterocapsa_arctica.AAC.1
MALPRASSASQKCSQSLSPRSTSSPPQAGSSIGPLSTDDTTAVPTTSPPKPGWMPRGSPTMEKGHRSPPLHGCERSSPDHARDSPLDTCPGHSARPAVQARLRDLPHD